MKNIYILLTFLLLVNCSTMVKSQQSKNNLKIISSSFIKDYVVFNTQDFHKNDVIVLANKNDIRDCISSKNFIILDSIYEVTSIKIGSKRDIVGYKLSEIDGVKIRNEGELVKIIKNCNSLR